MRTLHQTQTDLVRRQPRTQDRSDHSRIDVVWKSGEVIGIQRYVFLEAAILVMEMIRRIGAVLFCSSQAILALSAYSAPKSDTNIVSKLDTRIAVLANLNDAPNAFMASNMWKFDVGYRRAIC